MFTIISLILTLLTNGIASENLETVKIYSNTMCVVEVDYQADEVTIADFNGAEFKFTECGDWLEGDLCSVTMCDNGTDEIYDDIILDTRYSGWTELWGFDIITNEYLYCFYYD